jgi:hypothetical protein
MPPNKRVEFWRRNGARMIFYDFIQLTCEPKVFSKTLCLYLIPTSQESVSHITKNNLIKILAGMQIYSNGFTEADFKKNKQWIEMMDSLRSYPENIPLR